MSTIQITVRLPDVLVEFIDQEVAASHERSRADLIAKAVTREQKRIIAERDAAIYASTPNDSEIDAWTDIEPPILED